MRNRVLFLVLLSSTGCGPSPQALVPVTGKLTLNGRPIKGATIVFTPDHGKGGRGPQSFAVTADEGAFTLMTTNGPGAVAGWHRVTVGPPADDAELGMLMEKYLDPDRSGLIREIKAGAGNVIPLPLDVTP